MSSQETIKDANQSQPAIEETGTTAAQEEAAVATTTAMKQEEESSCSVSLTPLL